MPNVPRFLLPLLQTLYFCQPFRERVIAYAAKLHSSKHGQPVKENVLTCLAELFVQVQPAWRGLSGPAGVGLTLLLVMKVEAGPCLLANRRSCSVRALGCGAAAGRQASC